MARTGKNKTTTTGDSTPKAEETVTLPTEAPTDAAAPSDKPTANGTHDIKPGSSSSAREIEKRLAKWAKKKRGIEAIEAKVVGLNDQEKEITKLINPDEKKKLGEKSAVEERVKEYQELVASVNALLAAEEKARQAEKEALEAEYAAKIAEARREGIELGKRLQMEVLATCFRFLRLAGYRRALPDENIEENEAIEKVLVAVYSSEESATAAIEALASNSETLIEDTNVTYARVRAISDALHAGEDGPVEAVEAVEELSTQPHDLGDSTIIVTDADAESTPVDTAPPQTLVTPVEESHVAPANTLVDDAAANKAALGPVADSSENTEEWDTVKAGGKSADNGAIANIPTETPNTSWADQSHDEAAKAEVATPIPAEGAFQEVPSRSHGNRGRGFRGRGDFRGNFRGGPRGGFRGRGDGYRGRGEFRGDRGNFRGRGDRPYRPRGDRGSIDATQTQTQAPPQAQPPTPA
ncbi:hypothetical protein ABW19_dt0207056 [Dactylella cylindrospora]|nr:hypothetical protein ABW19_dt0207056 [Dactylella cylindrospora]